MRYLHPVAPHEAFVASGTYHYERDGELTGLVEHWTIHELPDGAWFMRTDRDGRYFDGHSELIEAWRSPDGHIERFDITAYGAPSDEVKLVKATYTIESSVLYVGRSINNGERTQEELSLPDDYVVQPGGYVFFGYALSHLVERAPLVMLSRYGFTQNAADAFSAGMMQPTLTFYGDDEATVKGKTYPARRYMAGESRIQPDGTRKTHWHNYWIDAHDILLNHEGPDMRVYLSRYAYRAG